MASGLWPGLQDYRRGFAMLLAPIICTAAAHGRPASEGAPLPLLTHDRPDPPTHAGPGRARLPRPDPGSRDVLQPFTAPTSSGGIRTWAPMTPDVFVQDATAGIWVNVPKDAPPLRAGQLVEMEGVTEVPDFAPQIGKPRYRVIGQAPLPQADTAFPRKYALDGRRQPMGRDAGHRTAGRALTDGMLTLDVAVAGGRLKALVPGIHAGTTPLQPVRRCGGAHPRGLRRDL